MAEIATVKIHGGKGEPESIIINKEDFDPKTHKIYEEKEPEVKEPEEDAGPSKKDLMKHSKAELVAMAAEAKLDVVPDEATKEQIVDALLAAAAAS